MVIQVQFIMLLSQKWKSQQSDHIQVEEIIENLMEGEWHEAVESIERKEEARDDKRQKAFNPCKIFIPFYLLSITFNVI